MSFGGWTRLVGCLVVLNALAQSFNPPRADDLTYVSWAAERAWDAYTPVFRPAPFPGWRPATNLVWWLSVSIEGATAILPQLALAGLWLTACCGIWRWVNARWGPRAALIALALLLLTDRFRDLVIWRSWLNITGELACIALCLWAMERGRWSAAIIAGATACWFKETATLPLACAAFFIYRRPAVAVAVLVAGVPGATKSAMDAGLLDAGADLPQTLVSNLLPYGAAVVGWVWPGAALVLIAGGWVAAGTNDARWLLPALLAVLPPLVYNYTNPTYMLEAVVFAIGPAAAALSRVRSRLLLAAILAVPLWSLPGSFMDVRWQVMQLRDQVGTIRNLDPVTIRSFHLDPNPPDPARWLALYLRYNHGIPASHAGGQPTQIFPGLSVQSTP